MLSDHGHPGNKLILPWPHLGHFTTIMNKVMGEIKVTKIVSKRAEILTYAHLSPRPALCLHHWGPFRGLLPLDCINGSLLLTSLSRKTKTPTWNGISANLCKGSLQGPGAFSGKDLWFMFAFCYLLSIYLMSFLFLSFSVTAFFCIKWIYFNSFVDFKLFLE